VDPRLSPFEQAAREAPGGLFREVFLFLRHNRKWWLTPILVLLAGFGLLILLAGTGAAPFIYTLF
jgi:hypothetical protein